MRQRELIVQPPVAQRDFPAFVQLKHIKRDFPAGQFLHVPAQGIVNAFPAPFVRPFASALRADHRDEIPVAVEEIEVLPVQIGPVGEDGEEQGRVSGGFFHDGPPEQRLPSRQQDEADSHVLRLEKHPVPVLRRELTDGLAVLGPVFRPGIAAGAVQVAGGGDAGNEESGDVQPLLLGTHPFFGSAAEGGGEFGHKGGFPGIPQYRADRVGHNGFRTSGDIVLQRCVGHGAPRKNDVANNIIA